MMFDNVVRLELRKQRNDFLVIIAFTALVVLCFILEAFYRNRNLGEVLKDVFVFVSLGFMFILALNAANAGRHLRVEPFKSAEELLPFSPIQRTLGAYSVNFFYLLVGSSVFLLITYQFISIKNVAWKTDAIFLIIHFHLLCFLFSYWLNQTVLAALISGIIVWCERAVSSGAIFLFFSNPFLFDKEPVQTLWTYFSFAVSIAGALIALSIVAARIERQRRVRWVPGIIASLVALAGGFLLLIDLARSSYDFQKSLTPGQYYYSWISEVLDTSSNQEKSGAYFFTSTGSIVHITPQERRILREVPLSIIPKINQDVITIYETPDHSRIWMLVRNENKYEIWNSQNYNKLKRNFQFDAKEITPFYFAPCGTELCLYGESGKKIAMAVVNQKGLGEWQFSEQRDRKALIVGHIRDKVFESKIKAGKVAVVSTDNRKIIRHLTDGTRKEWTLPGEAQVPTYTGSVIAPAFSKNGEPVFVVPVSKENNTSLFMCNPDGSVAKIWDRTWLSNSSVSLQTPIGGGQTWIRREPEGWKAVEAFVLAKDGTIYPPISLELTAQKWDPVYMLKMDQSNLWMQTLERIVKIDLKTGKTFKFFDFPKSKADFYDNVYRAKTKEGIYFIKDTRISLIDWDGRVHDLGPATLN